ncbi:hypothetical protein DVH24_028818 [Malus domestica]|uniref:RING-type E3 ubiquitin transferase n=1 Tax=Malus domestica TaxID=3750 RepID=A0A498IVB7_MALDO|nr:hypothetical protein DVH24_028818 [Malus domestica]
MGIRIESGFLFVLKISSLQLLVDHWVLLGIGRWSIFSKRLPSALLVFALYLFLSSIYLKIKDKLLTMAMWLCLQDGASMEDIEQLSKFRFKKVANEKVADDVQGGVMTECGTDSPIKHRFLLHLNDDHCDLEECCICLSCYDDGVELRQLPCAHHFHCSCINKWLFINASCPLCKYNILKSSSQN